MEKQFGLEVNATKFDDAVNLDSKDPAEQTHKVMQNIEQLIKEAGGEMKHLVK